MPSMPAAPRLRLTASSARRRFSSAATCSIRSSCIAFCRESRLARPSGPPVDARRGSTASASACSPVSSPQRARTFRPGIRVPLGLDERRSSSFAPWSFRPALPAFFATMASADFPFALTKGLSPGKALILSLHTVRLYLARLGWTLDFAVAGTLTARTRPLCRFVFLRSKVCFPLPSAWPRGLRPTTSALRFPTVTSIGPGRIVSSCENQPMLGTLAHAFSVPCRHSWRHGFSENASTETSFHGGIMNPAFDRNELFRK